MCHIAIKSEHPEEVHWLLFFRWQGEDGGDGRREISSVCPSLPFWKRSDNLLHSSRWRIWTHVISHQYACMTHFSIEFAIYANICYRKNLTLFHQMLFLSYRWNLWYGLSQSLRNFLTAELRSWLRYFGKSCASTYFYFLHYVTFHSQTFKDPHTCGCDFYTSTQRFS